MNVSLTPELERFVQEKVHSGRYISASEVVREALRLLEEHEKVRAAQLAEFREESDRRWLLRFEAARQTVAVGILGFPNEQAAQ